MSAIHKTSFSFQGSRAGVSDSIVLFLFDLVRFWMTLLEAHGW
jgi:hypothetical protein